MIKQGHIMILAPVRRERVEALRGLLATLNVAPGLADPQNGLVPFAGFENIHVARFVILDDETLGDRQAYPDSPLPEEQIYLTFIADCDGPGDALLEDLAARAADGLREIFRHCDGMDEATDLLQWMRARDVKPTTYYVNWVGRTVRQVREEAQLHDALLSALPRLSETSPALLHQALRDALSKDGTRLTPVAGKTIPECLTQIAGLLSLPLIGLVLSPFLILGAPFFLLILRRKETSDPVVTPRVDAGRIREMSAREDHDVTNPFSAIGSLKPGPFRRYLTRVILYTVNWSTTYIYTRGRLARVGTIHFARWVLLDDDRRVVFASNYDGSLESYMDDFINKVAFGLNLVFSNGIGYPAVSFLVSGGASREHEFKNFLRRHQLRTDVWYKAYPGLTTRDLARNARIRAGFDRTHLSDDEARLWLAEI
ncbi:MAG TPA: hypothetical protein VND94_13105 [Terriglobia bacterium]|nr:hypothetical protein [Terriglobia bacterium]